jgi:internalin A
MLDLDYEVPNPNEDATIGINCKRNFEFYLDGNIFKANIWDFGGQEIQNLIHKSFLSNNALYILVADNRSQNTNFEFWLKVFNMYKEGSRLLILFNNKNSISIAQ